MLEAIDLDLRLDQSTYRRELRTHQLQLRSWARRLYQDQRSLILVFEGWDAAGKGGAIRRLTAKLDPRGYRVYAIAAPEGDDREHHYLWRFWRRLRPPRDKQILIFDRSWYGRVLVERIEGFAEAHEWQRAYREIIDFESQLGRAGVILAKFWVHIDPDEQLRRFEARRDSYYKAWKLTGEDWRNRQRWDAYEEAVNEMLAKTSTRRAPWTVVEGNDKRWARVKVLRTVIETLERAYADDAQNAGDASGAR
jgi:polyphosphate kinase 2 (PPK2 family)